LITYQQKWVYELLAMFICKLYAKRLPFVLTTCQMTLLMSQSDVTADQ